MTENISTETQTSPTAEYEPLKVDFTPTPAVVPLVSWTWNTPVIPQFYWNVYSAEQRIKQICLEIGRIQEYLNYFAVHYNKMSGYLNKRIDKLTAAMYAEVERLDKAIEEENKARKLADELLQKGLDAEIARAKAAEVVLQQNIDTNTTLIEDEEKRAKDAEEKLTTDLHDETTARIAEDKKITDTVETNRQHAEEVDAQLFDSIRTEANLRKNADNVLSDRIDKETEERKANDVSINTRIDNEHAERVKADNELDKRVNDNQQAIEYEVERAKSAENNLNDALEREIDARVDTDRSLENNIDANDRASKERDNKLQGNIDTNANASKDRDKQLQANIDAEITNRGNAENAINDRITNEINDRKADDASINTRIDKEIEERKNDVASLNTRIDTEQTERVKSDNDFDKRVTNNTQAIEHETERAKSAETNLNDALEREVDARQDDTRNLENQIDKANNDSKSRDGVLQSHIEDEATKRATEDNKKVSVVNVKAAENSRITVKTSNENTENATVTIGDTFDADFKKIENTLADYKVHTVADLNQLTGALNNESEERRNETTALNAEVAKRPTLDKFIAGDNITLTPDVDKTTLTIAANTDENKVNNLISDKTLDIWNHVNKNEQNIHQNIEDIKEVNFKYNSTYNTSNIEERIKAGDNVSIQYPNNGESVVISAKNGGMSTDEQQRLDNVEQVADENSKSIIGINMTFDAKVAQNIHDNVNINGGSYIKVNKKSLNKNETDFDIDINKDNLPNKVLEENALLSEEMNNFNTHVSNTKIIEDIKENCGPVFVSRYLQAGDNITFTKPPTGESKLIINANLKNYKIDSHNNSIGVVEYEDKPGFDLIVNPHSIIKTTRFVVNEGDTMPTYAKHITVKSTNVLSVMPVIEFTKFVPIANQFNYYCMLDENSNSTLIFYKESAVFTNIKKYEIVVVYLVTE